MTNTAGQNAGLAPRSTPESSGASALHRLELRIVALRDEANLRRRLAEVAAAEAADSAGVAARIRGIAVSELDAECREAAETAAGVYEDASRVAAGIAERAAAEAAEVEKDLRRAEAELHDLRNPPAVVAVPGDVTRAEELVELHDALLDEAEELDVHSAAFNAVHDRVREVCREARRLAARNGEAARVLDRVLETDLLDLGQD